MNIKLIIDGVTLHVQFQNATGVGCLLSDSPIPGTGYGKRREVTRRQLQMISYGYRSVDRGDLVDLVDAGSNAIDAEVSVSPGDVLTTAKVAEVVRTR